MPFEIVWNDIVNMKVDSIVNTANPRPVIGSGCDAGIHKKAGPQLLKARKMIGEIGVGQVAVTSGYDLSAKYVFHAVGPVWQDEYGKNLTFKTGGVDGCNCAKTLKLFREGKLDTTPLITHTYPLREIGKAYDLFENSRDGVIKVAIRAEG